MKTVFTETPHCCYAGSFSEHTAAILELVFVDLASGKALL
jgi:hypothetical protein